MKTLHCLPSRREPRAGRVCLLFVRYKSDQAVPRSTTLGEMLEGGRGRPVRFQVFIELKHRLRPRAGFATKTTRRDSERESSRQLFLQIPGIFFPTWSQRSLYAVYSFIVHRNNISNMRSLRKFVSLHVRYYTLLRATTPCISHICNLTPG